MKIKPIKDLVLVEFEQTKAFETTKSGIILSNQNKTTVQKRPTQGKVIAIGPDVQNVKINDIVYFENVRGQDIDENHIMLVEKTILGILKPKGKK